MSEEKTRELLRYEVVVYSIKESLNEDGEWVEYDSEVEYEEDFATVYLEEGTPELNLGSKVLDLAKACARGYLKGVECPKWEVPE
jgi:hypothetical protein